MVKNANLPACQKRKCIEKCILHKQGLFDETNGLNVENVVKEATPALGESVARTIAQKCAVEKEESETDCDWASRAMHCLKAEEQSHLSQKSEGLETVEKFDIIRNNTNNTNIFPFGDISDDSI